MSISTFFKSLIDDFIYTIFPSLCLMCNEDQPVKDGILCFHCLSSLPLTDHFEIRENDALEHFEGRIQISQAASLLYFQKDSDIQNLLHNLKYKGQDSIGTFFGQRIAEKMEKSPYFIKPDVIVPIPIHTKKERIRGYNQSTLIANGISDVLKIPVVDDVLIKSTNTGSQTSLHRSERVKNVTNSFEILDQSAFSGRHILLVDDVLTTGATLEVAAQQLLTCNPSKISVVTLAIAR